MALSALSHNLRRTPTCLACSYASKATSISLIGRARQSFSSSPHHRQRRIPGHPDIYVHSSPSQGRHALSYLKEPPIYQDSPTVLGYISDKSAKLDQLKPADFDENENWREMLHEVISQFCWKDETLETQAVNRQDGFIHIIDQRCPPALNRAGEPEDIIASVLCKEGKLVEGTYEPNNAYRIVTSNGQTQLSESMAKKLIAALRVARSVEEDMQKQE